MAIVVVNPNPVFDRTIVVERLIPGTVMRTLEVEVTAGGKGVNVARALRDAGGYEHLSDVAFRGDLVAVKAVVAAGADVKEVDKHGWPPVVAAADGGIEGLAGRGQRRRRRGP